MGWFFVSVLRGCNKSRLLMEADSLSEAKGRVKKLPEYMDNYNSLPLNDTRRVGYIELDKEVEVEKVSECKYRAGRNDRGESLCEGIGEHENAVCIIHQAYWRFDLPGDCPYLINKSEYVSFQNEIN